MPKSNPLTRASSRATSVHLGVRTHRDVHGQLRKRLPCAQRGAAARHCPTSPSRAARQRKSAALRSTAARRMRVRRRAQREAQRHFPWTRSAARAANRLPRLAHAASRINPASSISPARNARTGRPRSRRAGRDAPAENVDCAVVFGIRLFQVRANRIQIGDRLRRRHARLEMPERPQIPIVFPRAFRTLSPSIARLFDQRHKKIGVEKQQRPVKVRRGDPEDGEGMLVQPHQRGPRLRGRPENGCARTRRSARYTVRCWARARRRREEAGQDTAECPAHRSSCRSLAISPHARRDPCPCPAPPATML